MQMKRKELFQLRIKAFWGRDDKLQKWFVMRYALCGGYRDRLKDRFLNKYRGIRIFFR